MGCGTTAVMGLAMDRNRFDRLMLAHLDGAHRFAIRLTGDTDAAEDVMQEALCRAARGWRTFAERSSFKTWLFSIVLNAFRDRRVPRERQELPEQLCDLRVVDPADAASASELGGLIARLVSSLPVRQREVLVMIVYEQLSIGEVAQVLKISETNVRANLSLGRRQLRKLLTPDMQREQS